VIRQKRKRFDSIQCHERVDSNQFDWIHCSVRTNLDSSTPGFLDSGPEAAGPVHRSHDRPARIATELLIALAEASSDIAANVSHDVILQHSDARS